jgi:hypothetical protein
MKVLVCYSTKDRPELTERTAEALWQTETAGDVTFDVAWYDGSADERALKLPEWFNPTHFYRTPGSNPDSIIVSALRRFFTREADVYSHLAFVENDVLLPPDWLMRALELYEIGAKHDLRVGAVSARAYRDRVLIQHDGFAVMHNIGAGNIVLNLEAAKAIYENYRTGYTTENREIFAILSDINIAEFWAFGNNQSPLTADWSWDACLARHGLASLAVIPQRARMIDQPLEAVGLAYANEPVEERRSQLHFQRFSSGIRSVHSGMLQLPYGPLFRQQNGQYLMFAHQLRVVGAVWSRANWAIKWSQGFGPFSYVALDEHALLEFEAFGPVSVLTSTLPGYDGRVLIEDCYGESSKRYKVMSPGQPDITSVQMPPAPLLRDISVRATGKGAVIHGIVAPPQPLRWTPQLDLPKEFFK